MSSQRRRRSHSVLRNGSLRGAHPPRRVLALTIAAAFAASGTSALANPTGGTVVSGSATFQPNGSTLNITNTPGAIINWQQFSIGTDEITRFIQQHAASGVLNRVTGQNPSAILGQLLSNGRVFLINPSGIAFGQGAIIDVAGFAASTLNISDADWLNGRMRFVGSGSEGALTNAGSIRTPEGGHVYLIAPNVENQATGVITSPKGEVVIAAGNSVELVNARTPDIRVELSAPENEAVNAGQVVAASGNIGIYGTLIKNSGLVSASRAEVGDGGKIVFKAVKDVTLDATSRIEATGAQGGSIKVQAETGTLLAQGIVEAKGDEGKGGEIQLLGRQVGLIGNAQVDASGELGGGTVLVGGDFQGKNPDVQDSEKTYVGRDALIRADAVTEGDGGKVIIWADETTRFYGAISARGGKDGGDGGFAEVSGETSLDASISRVNLGAPRGTAGTLLLDPQDIVINGGTADGSDSETGNLGSLLQQDGGTAGLVLFADGPDLFNIFESEIENTDANINLQARNSITVSGTFGVDTNGEGTGAIVRLKNDRSLTLDTQNAAGDSALSLITPGIDLTGVEFQTQGAGSITIRAGVTGTSPGGETANILLGPLTALGTGGIQVRTGNGSITAQSPVSATSGTVELDGAASSVVVNATIQTTSGAINVLADDDVTFGAAGAISSTSGNVAVTADADATADAGAGGALFMADGAVINAGSGTITLSADETVTLGRLVTTNDTASAVSITSLSGAVVDGGDTGGVDIEATGANAVVTINAVTGVGAANAIDTTITTLVLNNTTSGNVDINETNALNINEIDQDGAGSVNVDAGGTITVVAGQAGVSATSGTVELTASTALDVRAAIVTTGGTVDLTATGGTLTLGVDGDIGAGGAVTLTGGTGISVAADITTSDDNVTFAAATTLTGDVVINTGTAGGGDVAFNSTLTGTTAGAEDLTITAGTGNVTLSGTVGATRLGHILINSATNVSANAASATSIRQVAGTGTTTLNGAVNVNGAVPGTTSTAVVIANTTINTTGTSSITTGGGDVFLAGDNMSLGGAAGSISGGGAVTLTTQSAARAITLEGAGGLELSTTELNTISAPSVTIGTNADFLSTPAHTGTITVAGAANPTPAGLTAFNIVNGGTGGVDSVIFNATLTSPKPVTVVTSAGNIKFNPTGKILANGAAAADRVVNLTATAGAIDGNATNVASYIAGTPFSNVRADRLNAFGQTGVGVSNALITEVIDVQAGTTNTDINIYNVGALNLAGTGVNAGINSTGGNVTLVATGPIMQSAPVTTDALAVVTLNSPGADITLTDGGNDAQSYSLFACLALPGGCPTDTPVLSTSGTKFGNGSNANYAAGAIDYRDSNGANLSGIGTVSAFSTFTAGDTTITANSISASDITLEASGDIFIDLGSDLTKINNAGTGSFNLIAGRDITMLDSSGTIGTSGSTFNHALNLTAAGNITLNESIYQATKNLTLTGNAGGLSATGNQTLAASGAGSVTLQGNHVVSTGGDVTIRGVNFSLLGGNQGDGSGQSPNGQELTVTGTINLLNSGVITVQGGTADATSAAGARMTGGTINIGTNGGGSNPIRMLVQGGTNSNFGYVTSDFLDPLIELRQPDALVESTGNMFVYLRSDPAVLDPFGSPYSLQVRGGTATANDDGGQFRFATALAAMRAKNMTMVADGSVLLEGGTTNLNAARSFAATSAIVLVETEKRLTTTTPNASVIVRGGTANVSSSLSSVSARNALALAQLDPSKLFLSIGGRLVLEGGRRTGPAGSLTSARIDAGDEIQISVFGAPAPYTYTTSAGGSNTVTGSFLMIGGRNSGFFDSFNVPLGGDSYPKEFPITVSLLGAGASYLRIPDTGLGDGIVQTGLSVFDESLLSYIIFAANEETRAARIRRGAGEGDDLGPAACK